MPEESSPSPAAQKEELPRLLAWSWLSWLKPLTLKPVFAILIVGVVSALIGYRVYREQQQVSPSSEVAESLAQKHTALSDQAGASSQMSPPPAAAEPKARLEGKLTAERSAEGTEKQVEEFAVAAPRVSDDREGYRATVPNGPKKVGNKDQYAPEPPAASSESKNAQLPQPASPAVTQPPPPARQNEEAKMKESDIRDGIGRRDADAQLIVGGAGRSEAREIAQDKPVPAEVAAGAGGSVSLKKTDALSEQERNRKAELSSLSQPQQRDPQNARRKTLSETGSTSRLEAGGKWFELRDGVWKETSIVNEEAVAPVVILIPSPEFEKLRKALSPFQSVWSRPQDVLVKIENRVYLLKKKRD
jgi:hypothetical protein